MQIKKFVFKLLMSFNLLYSVMLMKYCHCYHCLVTALLFGFSLEFIYYHYKNIKYQPEINK